jgi:hypothetical protein
MAGVPPPSLDDSDRIRRLAIAISRPGHRYVDRFPRRFIGMDITEVVQEAFVLLLEEWRASGVPDEPEFTRQVELTIERVRGRNRRALRRHAAGSLSKCPEPEGKNEPPCDTVQREELRDHVRHLGSRIDRSLLDASLERDGTLNSRVLALVLGVTEWNARKRIQTFRESFQLSFADG